MAYIKVRGVAWETGVKLVSTANNIDTEPGDQNIRIIKFEFNLMAETFIPQPITRSKAVLKTKIDIFEGKSEEELQYVLDRLEEAVEELK